MIQYSSRQLLLLVVMDVMSVIAAIALSSELRILVRLGLAAPTYAFDTPPALFILVPVIWVVAFQLVQVYNLRRNLTIQLEVFNLLVGHFAASLLFWGLLYSGFRDYSRLQSLYVVTTSFIFIVGLRTLFHLLLRFYPTGRRDEHCLLIVGTDETAHRFGHVITTHHSPRLKLAGYVRIDLAEMASQAFDAPVLGNIDDLPALIEQNSVKEVIITTKWFDQKMAELIQRVLATVDSQAVNVRVAPDYQDIAYFHTSTETLYGMPIIGIRDSVFSPVERIIKRLMDILISIAALILTLPVMVVIALAIRLDSPGSILLQQTRIGIRGRPFKMFKFRSMYDAPVRATGDSSPYNLVKLRDDPRITTVGRFLRRTSLDELPQFFNVLIGDMSLVGPRPEVPWMVEQYEWWQRKRFEVPQGLTGWWQINGRADRPMHYHTSDDLYYIRNYSLWMDVQIILRTVIAVVIGRGAY